MTYTVVWRPSAERRLAEFWTNASDRPSITNAADSIDALLRSNPRQVGEPRRQSHHFLTIPPLSIYYDVHDDDRVVAVWAVWHHAKA